MEKILAVIRYEDQSTPLAAWLACLGSPAQKDTELYVKSSYTTIEPQNAQGHVEQVGYWADKLDVLYTPKWPENPGNGYVHPLCTSRKGLMICEGMQRIVYEDGKWYVHKTKSHFGAVNSLEKPTLQEIANAESKGYLAHWEVAGPYIQEVRNITSFLTFRSDRSCPTWMFHSNPRRLNLSSNILRLSILLRHCYLSIKVSPIYEQK